MSADLLVKTSKRQSLSEFIAVLPSLIGCDRWEMRESSNYVQGRYDRCLILGVQITAAIADHAEFSDYEIWIHFEPEVVVVGDKNSLDGLADCVAGTLALHGLEVIRPLNIGNDGSGAVLYRLIPTEDVRLRERVLTETI